MNKNKKVPESLAEALVFMGLSAGPLMSFFLMTFCVIYKIKNGWLDGDVGLILFLLLFRGFGEWFFHAFVWHIEKFSLLGASIKNPIATLHLAHHKNPADVNGIIFGWRAVCLAFFTVLLAASVALNDFARAVTLAFTVLVALAVYEWFHLLAHSNIKKIPVLFAPPVINHRQHHKNNGDGCFGVSSILGDMIFGTHKKHRNRESSQ